ncbi:MAG: hypothetical protein WDM78_05905 [Puia sp.]
MVAQFTISIVLIIATVIVFQQLRYMQRHLWDTIKNTSSPLPYYNDINRSFESFRNELLSNPDIKDVTRSSRIPTGRLLDAMGASTLVGDSMRPHYGGH